MASFTVTVDVELPDGAHLETSRTTEIPPDYDRKSTLHLFSLEVEKTGAQLIKEQADPDWEAPRLKALIANDARLVRIEELLTLVRQRGHTQSANEIQAVLETHEDQAIAQWGSPPIEEE